MFIMLEAILGNATKERILFYLLTYGEGYAPEICRTFGVSLRPVQLQLENLEKRGVVVSWLKGRTRIYRFNPRYYFFKELTVLLEKAIEAMPREERQRYFMQRTRPRRAGKPL
jgi:predicted transcriptional regulator